MRRKSKWTGIMIGVIFIGLQFTTSRYTNQTVDAAQTREGTTAVPAEVSALFDRSCNDCHSNKTTSRLSRGSLSVSTKDALN